MEVVLRGAGMPTVFTRQFKHGPMRGWMQINGVAHALLHTMAHAEAMGVVHRDIKPDHVVRDMGSKRDPEFARYAVIDWDAAAIIEGFEEGVAGGAVSIAGGTKGYMAPEMRALLKQQRTRSGINLKQAAAITSSKLDVYSVGCTLYKLMTGQCPPKDTCKGLSWPPAFPAAWPHIDELKQLIESCLAYEASDRPTFAQLLKQHGAWLEPFTGEQSITTAAYEACLDEEERHLNKFYRGMKQLQPQLYKQQRAWSKAAAHRDPQLQGLAGFVVRLALGLERLLSGGRKHKPFVVDGMYY